MSRKRKDEGGATGEGGSDARTAGDGGSDARTAGEGAEGGAEGERLRSDLEQGLESLGKVLTGVAGRLLGPKAVGKEALGPEPTLSPEADELIEKAGEVAGRYLHATGEALKEHPLAPGKALDAARGHLDDPLAGRATPADCALFGARCRPGTPVGACMVSSEGACRIAYELGGGEEEAS